MMTATRLRDMSWTVQFELRRRLGWPGAIGAAVFALAAVALSAAMALRADTQGVRVSLALARATNTAKADVRRTANDPADALARLPDLFPSFARNGEDVATILAQAHASNLTLGSAQYQVSADRSGPFTTYQVLLPVKDRYVSIRRFVALVLDNLPNAALQEIHVERPAVSGDVLEARIRFNLIYRASRS